MPPSLQREHFISAAAMALATSISCTGFSYAGEVVCRPLSLHAFTVNSQAWAVKVEGTEPWGEAERPPHITVKRITQYIDRPGVTLGRDIFQTPEGKDVARKYLRFACGLNAGPNFEWLRLTPSGTPPAP